MELFNRAMRGETPHYCNEKRYIRKDGNIIWVRIDAAFIRDNSGIPVRTVAICEDITERKIAEEKIINQNEASKSIYNLIVSMRKSLSTEDLLTGILEESCRLLYADDGTVMRLSRDSKHFTIVKAIGCWVEHVGHKYPVTVGLSSKVFQTGESYKTDNYSDEEEELQFLNQAEITGSMVLVPLKTEEELIGVLEMSRRKENKRGAFTTAVVELLTTIGEIAGNALRRQSLFESVQNRLKQLQGLRIIDTAIAGSLDLNLTFNVILNEVTGLLDLDATAVLRLEKILPYCAMKQRAASMARSCRH